MKITLGPLVSRASGRFGGTVASSWKGIDLVRKFRKPANPKTVAQTEVRNIFINLTRVFSLMGTRLKDAWDSQATGKAYIGRNNFIGKNVPDLQGQADLANLVATPGDASTIPPVSMTVTAGAGTLTVAVTTPTAPTGWTLTRVVAVALKDLDYGTVQAYADLTPTEGEDATSPYSIVLSGLTAAQAYRVASFIHWTAPDASLRYSAAIKGTGTPT